MGCHTFIQGAPVRIEWPDGMAFLSQPAITVVMFRLVTDEVLKELEAEQAK